MMILLCITIIVCTILLCVSIIGCFWSYKDYNNAMLCLVDLVKILNEKFPGSSLTVTKTDEEIKVTGELKYLMKHGD